MLGVFLLLFSCFFLVWLVLNTFRCDRIERQFQNLNSFYTNLAKKHNLLCYNVFDIIDFLNKGGGTISNQALIQKLNELEYQVDRIVTNWNNDWGSGDSWREGYRPDGSQVEDDVNGDNDVS